MDIPRRGFFSQMAGLLASIPALLGMKPKDDDPFGFKQPSGPDSTDWKPNDADIPLPPGWYITMIGQRGNIVCSEKLSEHGLEAIRWVSVSERLPKLTESLRAGTFFSNKLLGVRELGSIIVVMYVDFDGDRKFMTCSSGHAMEPVHITHWAEMPLIPKNSK